MSKSAVLLLPIFITSISTTIPIITNGDVDSHQNLNYKIEFADHSPVAFRDALLARNYSSLESYPESQPLVFSPESKITKVLVTAYSSTPEETDDTPFITASGSYCHYGVIAANFLPFGTKIRLPKIFGDQIFTVEDRLRSDYNERVDVWFPTKGDALKFGSQITEIEIL